MPTASSQVLPEMLPPIPTLTPSITGPRLIVTAGMAPVAGGVTLLQASVLQYQFPCLGLRYSPKA